MSNLRIEFVPIQKFALGWFGFDHLQVVYEPDEIPLVPNPQDDWYVIEGDSASGEQGSKLGVLGESGRLHMSTANLASGDDLVAKIGTPETRGSRILTPNSDNSGAWAAIAEYGAEIEANDFPYLAYGAPYTPFPTFNSSSVVASLLWEVGIDVNLNMPYGIRVSPGTSTFLGTTYADIMTMPTANFDTLAGGYENDDLTGSNSAFRVDKLFGGADDDTFHWSTGLNIVHGGDPKMARDGDGYDRADYSGASTITVSRGRGGVRGVSPDFIVSFTGSGNGGGTDWLYSIESIRIDGKSDTLIFGRGVTGLDEDLIIDMGGQDTKKGDVADFSQAEGAIVMVADSADEVRVSTGDEGGSKSWWVTGAEFVIGSEQDDEFHLDEMMLGADGGAGDDIIDSRAVTAGTGASPEGFDAEISGGAGQDTLISGEGRTLAKGGAGVDTFILGALSRAGQPTELVIDDATSEDHLLVPLNFFDGHFGSADNSLLLPLLGGTGNWAVMDDQTAGAFIYQNTQQSSGDDQTAGIIPFTGQILYYREGSDLVIRLVPGEKATQTINFEGHPSYDITYANLDFNRETVVRVRNFQPGMLGITFEEPIPGEEIFTDEHGFVYTGYTNWDQIANRLTNNGSLTETLDPIPVTHGPPRGNGTTVSPIHVDGTASDDAIDLTISPISSQVQVTSTTTVTSGEGNDTIITGFSADRIEAGSGDDTVTTGAGEDIIDGGTGADAMTGGFDDDIYYVDSAGDVVVEQAKQGRDSVTASVDYTLTQNVEILTLTGSAVSGTGNTANNTLIGNDGNNVLDGAAGDDTLYGAAGDDVLTGGDGSDTYVYTAASGQKTIIDTGASTDTDALVLSHGIKPGDIHAYRLTSAPDDLILSFSYGGWVKIQGQLIGHGIEEVVFDDGTTWTRADLAAMTAPLLDFPPPEALDDTSIFIYGQNATIPSLAVLGNDLAFDNVLHITSIGSVSTGTVTIDANGDIVVAAPAGYSGDVTFTYTVTDNHGETASATATVSIVAGSLPANTSPVAHDDTIAPVSRNTTITLAAADLVGNDTDADGDVLTITGVSNATHGTVQLTGDGNVVFIPDSGYAGPASFTYTVADPSGATTFATANLTLTLPSPVTRTGTTNGDSLNGGAGDDTLNGFAGADALNGGLGADIMDGGDGNDVYYVDNQGDMAIETSAVQAVGGFDIVHATVDYALAANVEQLMVEGGATAGTGNDGNNVLYGLGSTHALTLDGGAGSDTLYGSLVGGNTLIGGEGADTMFARGGGNMLTGGNGNDHYYIGSATDAVVETNAVQTTGGFDVVHASIDYVLTANVEQLLLDGAATTGTGNDGNNVLYGLGSTHALTLDGGAGSDTLYGSLFGGNTLIGGDGADTIFARGGNNTLIGGSSNDHYYIDSATDLVIEANANQATGGFDVVHATIDYTLTANVEQLMLTGAATTAIGNDGNNVLYGLASSLALTLDGGAGSDTLYGSLVGGNALIGGDGGDTMFARGGGNTATGGNGNDIYYSDSATDLIVEATAIGGTDTLYASYDSAVLAANVENLVLQGNALSGTGNGIANTMSATTTHGVALDGGAGADYIIGTTYDDILMGGTGNDLLDLRNGGHDTIRYTAAGFGSDTVRGFDATSAAGQDWIDLTGRGFTSASLGAGIQITASGSDTLITIGSDSVRLTGVDPAILTADNFKF
ncbi:MAG: cadherin-like domain-containing protein [Hyphomicrobiaceae bacterium]